MRRPTVPSWPGNLSLRPQSSMAWSDLLSRPRLLVLLVWLVALSPTPRLPLLPLAVCGGPAAATAAETDKAKDKDKGKKKDRQEEDQSLLKSSTLSGLAFRALGPALTSGRVGDFAVHPRQKQV
jgi:hypothetical protein